MGTQTQQHHMHNNPNSKKILTRAEETLENQDYDPCMQQPSCITSWDDAWNFFEPALLYAVEDFKRIFGTCMYRFSMLESPGLGILVQSSS